MEKLHISQNKRYFENADKTPFIWLADTAWTIVQRLKWDDVDYYMGKRKAQGFTVLQIVALDPEKPGHEGVYGSLGLDNGATKEFDWKRE